MRAAALLLVAALLLAGCTDAPPAARPAAPALRHLVASAGQFRFDEGTRRLRVGVTDDGGRDISVTRATIAWDGLAFPTVRLPPGPVHPGQTAAFTLAYGRPRCSAPPVAAPTLVAVVDGMRTVLPLHVDQPGLLGRLRASACAQQRLASVATVRLRIATRTVRRGAGEYLPAEVVLLRRAGTDDRVRLVDLGGSVLLDLRPRDGRSSLPGVLSRGARELSFPVLFGSAHRCDGHARGQSSQTFLVSGYVRLGSRPAQRVVFPLTSAEKDRLIGLVDRDCDRSH